tara:strand:+ start:313 stop:1098 length:786 start_codon:yes stop_codon:yes gene_type:complete
MPYTFATTLPDPNYKRDIYGRTDSSGTAGPGFAAIKLTSDEKMMVSRTNSQRVISRSAAGQKWMIDIKYNPMTRDEFEPVNTFLLQKRGPLTPFFVELPQYKEPRNSAFSSSTHVNGFTSGVQSAGATSITMGGPGGYTLKNAAGTTISTGNSNTTDLPTNIPSPGDVLTVTDSADSNHTKVYMVTYVETFYQYQEVKPHSTNEGFIRVGINPPLTRAVSNGSSYTFKNVKFKVIKPKALQEYELNTENLYSFALRLEEYL